jgi:hypothetical protein
MKSVLTSSQPIYHINGNKLDNTRENLKISSKSQLGINRKSHGKSKYLGVSFNRGKWIAQFTIGGRQIYIGSFINQIDAAKARDKKIKEYYPDTGRLNFI